MATAGEGSSYEGGAGGKVRRRPHRRPPSTPYDRPPTAIRRTSAAATVTSKTSWVLRLGDPASRIISTGDQKLFSSVFRKTHILHALPPPPLPPEPNHDTQNNSPEAVAHNVTEANEGDRLHNNSDTNVISDLEQILKQMTFTRSEIDHLTELLQSITVDESAENKKKRSEPSTSKLVASFGGTESSREQETHSQSLIGKVPPPVFLEDGVATPVDYAKAYMGSKNSNKTPSKFGWLNQASRENAAVPYITQKSSPFGTSSSAFSISTGSFRSGSGTTSNTSIASQSAPTSRFGTTSSTSFVFGAPSAASTAVGRAPMNFGSPFGASSSPFSFTSAAATTLSAPNSSSFPVFPTSNSVSIFASTPVVSVFGHVASSPQRNLMFGSPSGQSFFQMNGQQTPAATQNPSPFASATTQNPSPFSAVTAQNPSPFQGSGRISGFDATGSFSLGTGGDKSNRKIIKVRRDKRRRR